MQGMLSILVFLGVISAPYRAGYVVHYAPHVMEHVVRLRVAHGYVRARNVVGYVSVPDCNRLGDVVRIRVSRGAWHRYQVMDCSAPKDRARHIRNGLIAELDYASAVREGVVLDGRSSAAIQYTTP